MVLQSLRCKVRCGKYVVHARAGRRYNWEGLLQTRLLCIVSYSKHICSLLDNTIPRTNRQTMYISFPLTLSQTAHFGPPAPQQVSDLLSPANSPLLCAVLLYCTILYCFTVLYCTVLHCTVVH